MVEIVIDRCDHMSSGLDMFGSCSNPSPDWAFLPRDLVIFILEKLVSEVSDYVRCAAVCKNWLSAASDHQARSRRRSVFFPELLVLTKDKSEIHRGFYNAIENRIVKSRLHIPCNKRCCGSSHGWLILPEETMALTLFNPFTGAAIHLPPVFSPPTEEIIEGRIFYDHQYEIQKVVLSADPTEAPNNYEALAIFEHCNLAFFRSGSSAWVHVKPDPGEPTYEEVTYFNGKFYAASLNLLVRLDVVYDDKLPGNPVSVNVRKLVRREFTGYIHKVYLVGTPYGHLLWVDRYYRFKRVGIIRDEHDKILDYFETGDPRHSDGNTESWNQHFTSGFKVYKVNEETGGEDTRLMKLKTLEGDVLFLGHNDSILVSIRNFSEYEGNHIYYTDDCLHIINGGSPYPFGATDIGVFDIKDQCCKQLDKAVGDRTKGHMPPPIWILPRANLLLKSTNISNLGM